MGLLEIAFVAVIAGVILFFGALYWLESRRPEVRRPTEVTEPSDPAAGTSHARPGRPRRNG
jgi:hypothetical protein